MAYACYTEDRGDVVIGLFGTREQAERRNVGRRVAEVPAAGHVHGLDGRGKLFRQHDQSYRQLRAAIETE